MGKAKTIQLLLVDGNLDGILTIQETTGWGSGILVGAPRINADQLFLRSEVDQAGIYFLLSEDQVYVGQSQNSVKTRLSHHIKEKDWWDRVIVLTKTDQTLTPTDVQYLESKFIQRAQEAGTSDMDNKTNGNTSYISEFNMESNNEFMDEALLLLELIGIKVFASNPKKKKVIETTPTPTPTQPGEIKKTNCAWHPDIANITFHYVTKNGGDASMRWIRPNEWVLLAGSKLGYPSNNLEGERAQKVRNRYNDKIVNSELVADISLSGSNPTSQIVIGGAANAWAVWKNDEGDSLDTVINRLNNH